MNWLNVKTRVVLTSLLPGAREEKHISLIANLLKEQAHYECLSPGALSHLAVNTLPVVCDEDQVLRTEDDWNDRDMLILKGKLHVWEGFRDRIGKEVLKTVTGAVDLSALLQICLPSSSLETREAWGDALPFAVSGQKCKALVVGTQGTELLVVPKINASDPEIARFHPETEDQSSADEEECKLKSLTLEVSTLLCRRVNLRSDTDIHKMIELFSANKFLKTLESSSASRLLSLASYERYQPGDVIFKEADMPNEDSAKFYILVHGAAHVHVQAVQPSAGVDPEDHSSRIQVMRESEERYGGCVLSYLEAGQSFGELALLNNSKRNATVIAGQICGFCVIRKAEYESVLKVAHMEVLKSRIDILRMIPPLADWTDSKVYKVANMLKQEKYNHSTQLLHEGDAASDFFLVISGHLQASMKCRVAVQSSEHHLSKTPLHGPGTVKKKNGINVPTLNTGPAISYATRMMDLMILGPRDYAGDLVLTGVTAKQPWTIKVASEECEVFRMDGNDFMSVFAGDVISYFHKKGLEKQAWANSRASGAQETLDKFSTSVNIAKNEAALFFPKIPETRSHSQNSNPHQHSASTDLYQPYKPYQPIPSYNQYNGPMESSSSSTSYRPRTSYHPVTAPLPNCARSKRSGSCHDALTPIQHGSTATANPYAHSKNGIVSANLYVDNSTYDMTPTRSTKSCHGTFTSPMTSHRSVSEHSSMNGMDTSHQYNNQMNSSAKPRPYYPGATTKQQFGAPAEADSPFVLTRRSENYESSLDIAPRSKSYHGSIPGKKVSNSLASQIPGWPGGKMTNRTERKKMYY